MYTIKLEHVNKDFINVVGGKGANLGELIQAGLPVPGGFCITSGAYDYYLEQSGQTGVMPDDLQSELLNAYHELGRNARVAVRSSATLEDLKEASFAGQQETYLNVFGDRRFLTAVEDCFASLWNKRAADYRDKSGFGECPVSIAVVVQLMVESDAAGVMFTADPVSNDLDTLLINASYGLGEAVVSGRVTPDRFSIDKARQTIKSRVIGSKELAVRYHENGLTSECLNEPELKDTCCLTDEQIDRLVTMGKNIEAHYGYPQDIEWALKDNMIFILQSRAITTLKDEKQTKTFLTDEENDFIRLLKEFYPELPYPLELTILNKTLQTAFGFDADQEAVAVDDHGKLVFHLPEEQFELDDDDEEMSRETDFEENIMHSERIFAEIAGGLEQIQAQDLDLLPVADLKEILERLLDSADTIVKVRFQYNIHPGFSVSSAIREYLSNGDLGCSEYDLLTELAYVTSNMNIALQQLAELINGNEMLKNQLTSLETDAFTDEVFDRLAQEYPDFGNRYQELLKTYGWKSTNAHKSFSASSWNEDKTKLAAVIKLALAGSNKIQTGNKYQSICRRITETFPAKEADNLLRLIEEFRQYHVNREESVYLLEWIYGLCRLTLKAVSGKFPLAFGSSSDILYLTIKEFRELSENCDQSRILQTIKLRKQSKVQNNLLWHREDTIDPAGKESVLTGESGSTGIVSGEVCVINDVSEFSKIKPGQVLVCRYTDPMWTPLFCVASAIVAETGGVLSHAAIVAREYGIPAVMNCTGALSVLKDGQNVVVDGGNGCIHLESTEETAAINTF